MRNAHVNSYVDLSYKNGFVQCACGWRKDLGNGFNGYHIDQCPDCCAELETRHQRKVITGNPRGRNLSVSLGDHIYFVLDGEHGIHVQFSANPYTVRHGLSERQADAL